MGQTNVTHSEKFECFVDFFCQRVAPGKVIQNPFSHSVTFIIFSESKLCTSAFLNGSGNFCLLYATVVVLSKMHL